ELSMNTIKHILINDNRVATLAITTAKIPTGAPSGEYVNPASLETLSGPALVALHNANVVEGNRVKRFSTKAVAVERTWAALMAEVVDNVWTGATSPAPEPAPEQTAEASDKPNGKGKGGKGKTKPAGDKPKRSSAGVHIEPKDKVEPVIAGSKQHILIQQLTKPNGATMPELQEALGWTETSVRSGFYWDLRNKGYGVRQDGDRY